MNDFPGDLKYALSHEWVRVEGDEAIVGISDFAQAQLGDLVFVELPLLADEVFAGKEAAVVESVKTASDVYSPVTGEVIAINEELTATPEVVNQDPYGQGWLFKVKMLNAAEVDDLLSADDYEAATNE